MPRHFVKRLEMLTCVTYLLTFVLMFVADNCTRIVLTVYDGLTDDELSTAEVQRDIANVTKMAILDIAVSIRSFTVHFNGFTTEYDDELNAVFFEMEMYLCAYDVHDTLLDIFRNRNEDIADAFASRLAQKKGIDADDMMASIYLPIQFRIALVFLPFLK